MHLIKKNLLKEVITSFFILAVNFTEAADIYKLLNIHPNGNEIGVLVLAPGMNANGEFFLTESSWIQFAEKNNLGIIALNYSSNITDLYEKKCGYYFPEKGSGQKLLDSIRNIYGKDLPILIYGFSGGAQFASRFVNWAPERIVAWCAYSAQFWDYPSDDKRMIEARGIVACGDLDAFRWQPSFDFYYQGRKSKLNWIWVNIADTGHERNFKFEEFVRNFFDEEIKIIIGAKKPKKDIYGNIFYAPCQTTEQHHLFELKCPFRTQELLNNWKRIQAP